MPVLPAVMLRRKGPPGCVTPMAPNTFELLLKTMLPSLELAVETAVAPAISAAFEVKIFVCGPPTTPTLRVPVVPEADMSTPPRMPVASNGVMPLPMADWRCAWLGAHKTTFTAMNDSDRSFSRIIYAFICCVIRLKTQRKM